MIIIEFSFRNILLGVGLGWSIIGGLMSLATGVTNMFLTITNYLIFLIIFIGLIAESKYAN